jgi:TolB-like protein/Flp pilus assembly protein TadD
LSLFNELKRRNVLRVGAAYIVVAWLVIQVVETLFPIYGMSDAAIRLAVTLLAIGLLPVVVLAWAFELTPEGLKKDKDVDRSQSITLQTGKKLDRIIMVVLALALGYFGFDKFVLSPERQAAELATATETAHQEGRTEALVESYGEKSIAVLPFVNMSDDTNNEYFSDGISEELLNLLAKIPELRVTSRSSAFAFKGEKIDVPEVAKKLNVAHILEGSVRKAGNQVRITAQLIEARSDTHLWSETYDRTLNNIFAIQDEIASAVVKQLRVVLLGEVPLVQETDPEAYALYLQGRHLRGQNTAGSLEQAQELLQQALVIDPDYAPAWVALGSVYTRQTNRGRRSSEEGFTLVREALNKALAIDPGYAPAYASLGWFAMTIDNDLFAAAQYLERALQLEPTNPSIIRKAAHLSASLGRLDEAITLDEFVTARDPVSAAAHSNLGLYYIFARRWDEAIDSYNTSLTLSPGFIGAQSAIGVALLFKGDLQGALEAMQLDDSVFGMIGLPLVYHALGQANESDAALAELIEKHEQGWAYNIAYVFAYRGEADRAFEWLDKAVENKDGGLSEIIGERLFDNIHDDPRWLPFLESIGKSPEQLDVIEFEVTLPELGASAGRPNNYS